jgi:hypothetical protein
MCSCYEKYGILLMYVKFSNKLSFMICFIQQFTHSYSGISTSRIYTLKNVIQVAYYRPTTFSDPALVEYA